MPSAFGNLSGSGTQQVWVYAEWVSNNQGGNYSTYLCEVRYYGNGYGSWTGSTQYWSANFGGTPVSGTFTIPQSQAYQTYTVLYSAYLNRTHDAAGNLGAWTASASIDTNHSSIGDGSVAVTVPAPPRIPKVPGKPPKPVLISATPTEINYSFFNPADEGGVSLTTFRHQVATNAAFTTGLQTWDDSNSPGQAAALTPGVTHYLHYAAINSIGIGPYSDVLSQTTLPAVAPGFVVSAAPSGQSADLAFSPPGGVSGVTKYTYERRPTPAPQTPVTSADSATTSATVAGLTPGDSYDWRASAWIGAYQSPWSVWTTLVQPKPNTSPGDYFDGATPDTPDTDYSWDGTANLSASTATGKIPAGWLSFGNGNPTPGASGAIYQVTDPAPVQAGGKAARAVFFSDQTVAGFTIGTDSAGDARAQVVGDATYVGSIYVKTSKATRGKASIGWMTGAGASLGYGSGVAGQTVAGEWQRFTVTAVAPTTAVYALVSWVSEAGTGYSAFVAGDSVTADAAMLTLGEVYPYFDGDSSDPAFVFAWEGVAHKSQSTRTPVIGLEADPLDDPDCPPPPSPPRPPVVPADCIDEIGVWRRYWVTIDSVDISDWLAVIPTMTITSGRGSLAPAAPVGVNQVRIRIYENPDNVPATVFGGTEYVSEQIISYMPPFAQVTLDGVSERTWAQVGSETAPPVDAAALPADRLIYGSGGTPASWPLLSCGLSYLLAFDVPLETLPGNPVIGMALTERAG